jgi:L-fucose isomerase-like protein
METKIDREELAKQISGSIYNADDMQEALRTIHKDYEYAWLSSGSDGETHTGKEELREQLYLIDTMVEQLNNKI